MLWLKGPIKTPPHTQKNALREKIGFPPNTKLKNTSYPRHNKKLPGPCFKTDNTTLVNKSFILQRHHCLFTKSIIPYRPYLAITIWFQTLFTPQQGFFSAFPHGTKYAIGLEMYLELGVDATHIQTQYPMHPTQENKPKPQQYTFTGLSPSTAQTIPSQLQHTKKRVPKNLPLKTPHLHKSHNKGFSLSYIVFARRY